MTAPADDEARQATTVPPLKRQGLREDLPVTAARAGNRPTVISTPLALPFGSTPLDSAEGRQFLQDRLALFSRTVFLLSGFAWGSTQLLELGIPSSDIFSRFWSYGGKWHAVGAGISLGVWLVTRRRQLSLRGLFALDFLGALLALSAYALMSLANVEQEPRRMDLVMMLATMSLLTLRAVIIPSTPRHTLAVSGAAAIPGMILAYYMAQHAPPGTMVLPAYVTTGYVGVWTVLALAISGVASHVIYGLRAEVAQARKLGQYMLEEKIGEGGMGLVYKARHALLRRPTAIKLVLPERVGALALRRFEREVQLTAMLTHPNTVSIYDYGRTPEGVFYYAMEYLDGVDLEELVDRFGPQPSGRVAHILQQIAGSLAEAHGVGLVHRDIKPANVILCDRGGVPETAKVVDFGLVKDVSTLGRGSPSLSSINAIIGTPLYLAPEAIATPDSVDGRADLYALGAVGYFLLTGQPVFLGGSVVEVCAQHLHATPIPPSLRLGQPVSPALETTLLRCLAKKVEERPQTALELLHELRESHVAGWGLLEARDWWKRHGAEARARRRPVSGAGARQHDTMLVDLASRRAEKPR